MKYSNCVCSMAHISIRLCISSSITKFCSRLFEEIITREWGSIRIFAVPSPNLKRLYCTLFLWCKLAKIKFQMTGVSGLTWIICWMFQRFSWQNQYFTDNRNNSFYWRNIVPYWCKTCWWVGWRNLQSVPWMFKFDQELSSIAKIWKLR